VQRRAEALARLKVIAPRSYRGSVVLRYLDLTWRAMTARGHFDGVEVHWLFPTGLIGLLAARLRGIPLVVYAHGDDVKESPHRSWLHGSLIRLICRWADAVVTNSADTANHIRRLGREAEVIPPGVDLERFRPTARPARRRVLFLGGSADGKGLEIARGLADTVAGPGIDERLPEQIPALIAHHDVVLVPSRQEGFGLVAAEAIASGRWVVASAVGGLLEVVTDGVNGTLVDDGDFKGAIERVPADYDPFVVAATADRFSLEIERERFAVLWNQVLHDHGNRR